MPPTDGATPSPQHGHTWRTVGLSSLCRVVLPHPSEQRPRSTSMAEIWSQSGN